MIFNLLKHFKLNFPRTIKSFSSFSQFFQTASDANNCSKFGQDVSHLCEINKTVVPSCKHVLKYDRCKVSSALKVYNFL